MKLKQNKQEINDFWYISFDSNIMHVLNPRQNVQSKYKKILWHDILKNKSIANQNKK